MRGVEPWSASVPRGVAEARPNAAGQLLYRLRQKAEISQSELGARVDVPQAVIARYERGDIDDKLTMQFICRVAEACGAAMGLGEWRTAERGAHRVGPAGGRGGDARKQSGRGRASVQDLHQLSAAGRGSECGAAAGPAGARIWAGVAVLRRGFIPLGLNFVTILRQEVSACDVLLALIGPRWAGIRNEAGGRCLDNELDFVRIEIATALARDIPVVPVLFDGAAIPRQDELPDELKELALRNGLSIRHDSFHADAGRLARALEAIAAEPEAQTSKRGCAERPERGEEGPNGSTAARASKTVPCLRWRCSG